MISPAERRGSRQGFFFSTRSERLIDVMVGHGEQILPGTGLPPRESLRWTRVRSARGGWLQRRASRRENSVRTGSWTVPLGAGVCMSWCPAIDPDADADTDAVPWSVGEGLRGSRRHPDAFQCVQCLRSTAGTTPSWCFEPNLPTPGTTSIAGCGPRQGRRSRCHPASRTQCLQAWASCSGARFAGAGARGAFWGLTHVLPQEMPLLPGVLLCAKACGTRSCRVPRSRRRAIEGRTAPQVSWTHAGNHGPRPSPDCRRHELRVRNMRVCRPQGPGAREYSGIQRAAVFEP